MRRRTKIIVLALVLMLFATCFVSGGASAKSIYFAGKYKNSKGKVELQQYSSPEMEAYGLNAGYARFYGFKDKRKNTKIQLYKKSANRYESSDGFITVKVKKKSIVVKGGIPDWDKGYEISLKGKYKRVKRYPRPQQHNAILLRKE